MKTARWLLPFLVLGLLAARAGEPDFPGLKSIMSEADWQRARLDRLEADEVRLINEAFARYLATGATLRAKAAAESEAAAVAAAPAAVPAAGPKRSLWARFGLVGAAEQERRERPIMQAKVTAWKGANGFVLDNGQVWEGIDPIREELVGRTIGIKEGRLGSFLLLLDDVDTKVRVHRVK